MTTKTKPAGTYDSAFKAWENMREQRDKLRDLMAACTQLLTACKQVDVAYETLSDGALNGAIDNMRAAIAKAAESNQ
jgi:hypothetical protein